MAGPFYNGPPLLVAPAASAHPLGEHLAFSHRPWRANLAGPLRGHRDGGKTVLGRPVAGVVAGLGVSGLAPTCGAGVRGRAARRQYGTPGGSRCYSLAGDTASPAGLAATCAYRSTGRRRRARPSVIRLVAFVRRPRHGVRFSRAAVFRRDRHTCQYCGVRPRVADLTLDHVLPRHRGGRDTWENLVTACRPCNQRKGGRTPEEARMPLLCRPQTPTSLVHYHAELANREAWAYWVGTAKMVGACARQQRCRSSPRPPCAPCSPTRRAAGGADVANVLAPTDPTIAERCPQWASAWASAEYLAMHGSEAYGPATDESDVDLKGAYIPVRASLLGYRGLPSE